MQSTEQTIEQLRAENQQLRNQLEIYRKALEKHLPVYEGDESEIAEMLAHLDEQQSPSEFIREVIADLNHE